MKDFREIYKKYISKYGKKEPINVYVKIHGDAMPLMELMGNSVINGEFKGDIECIYMYCLINNKTWQEVVGYTPSDDDNIVY